MITELKHINTELVRSKMPGMPESKKDFPVTDFSRRKLDQFYQYWVALQENRVNWQKWAKYYTGDQWHEYISDGTIATEYYQANL